MWFSLDFGCARLDSEGDARMDVADEIAQPKEPPINPADYAGVNYNPTYAQAGIVGRFFKIGAAYKFKTS